MSRTPTRVLWLVLVAGLLLNVTGSTGLLPLAVGLTGGGVVALAVAGLVRERVSRR